MFTNFLRKLIFGSTDCSELLCLTKFKMNSFNSRNSDPFYPIYSDENYLLHGLANLLMIAGNIHTFDYL